MTLQTLTKQAYEERIFQFDFSGKMEATATISSIVSIISTNLGNVSGSTNVTVASAAASAQVAQALFSGGTSGETYQITAKVIDSDGQKLEADGLLRVQDE